jgi:adenine phosphoribosyltransferase
LDLKPYIRSIPDFPKPGILFRDITPLLSNPDAFSQAIKEMSSPYMDKGIKYVAAVEARGFIFGSAIAYALDAGFIPLRKKGKLPHQTVAVAYGLEYGQDAIEVHMDAIRPGDKVLLVDDLLATGGTIAAACELVRKLGAEICGLSFLVELSDLHGRQKIQSYPLHVVLSY